MSQSSIGPPRLHCCPGLVTQGTIYIGIFFTEKESLQEGETTESQIRTDTQYHSMVVASRDLKSLKVQGKPQFRDGTSTFKRSLSFRQMPMLKFGIQEMLIN